MVLNNLVEQLALLVVFGEYFIAVVANLAALSAQSFTTLRA